MSESAKCHDEKGGQPGSSIMEFSKICTEVFLFRQKIGKEVAHKQNG